MRRTQVAFLWLTTLGYVALHALPHLGVSRPLPLDWVAFVAGDFNAGCWNDAFADLFLRRG